MMIKWLVNKEVMYIVFLWVYVHIHSTFTHTDRFIILKTYMYAFNKFPLEFLRSSKEKSDSCFLDTDTFICSKYENQEKKSNDTKYLQSEVNIIWNTSGCFNEDSPITHGYSPLHENRYEYTWTSEQILIFHIKSTPKHTLGTINSLILKTMI